MDNLPNGNYLLGQPKDDGQGVKMIIENDSQKMEISDSILVHFVKNNQLLETSSMQIPVWIIQDILIKHLSEYILTDYSISYPLS